MAVRLIEEKTCDWCGGDDEVDLRTHRLAFDRKAVEVEVHDGCIEEANVPWLLDHGRKATAAEVAAAGQMRCEFCGKTYAGYMGIAQHVGRAHQEIDPIQRSAALHRAKQAQAT